MLRRLAIVALGAAAAVLAPAALRAADDGGRTPKPVIEAARAGTQCVAPADVMRRTHMELLKHQRDDTVRAGVRGAAAQFSLAGCIDCHASRTTGSVAKAETNFCVGCHAYAAVTIDCFQCHSSKPRK